MLIGVLLAVAAMPVSSKQQKKNTAGEQSEDMQKSVLISAEGGGNPVVVQNIQEAVMALFQVDAHRIRIMKMK